MVAIAGSVQGYAHKKNQIPNQDTFSYLINETYDLFVAIVSDGAGSAINAKLGSSFCCYDLNQALMNVAIDFLEQDISNQQYEENILLNIDRHVSFLNNLNEDIKTFHHTMSAVIFSPKGGKVIQIGDSPIIITSRVEDGDKDNEPNLSKSVVFNEEKQEGYANLTHFLTSENWRENLKIYDLPEATTAVFLMSDGAGKVFAPRGSLHAPAMLELLRRFKAYEKPINETLDEFLDMKEINGKTADDKTIIAYFPKKWIGDYILSSQYGSNNISKNIFVRLEDLNVKNLNMDRTLICDFDEQSIALPKISTNDKVYFE